MWRYQHLKTVERIIGGHVIGTQGTPVEVLGRRIDLRFFPELWTVRDEITRRSPLGADGHGHQ
jgi:tryptophan 2,3-dioxygenase